MEMQESLKGGATVASVITGSSDFILLLIGGIKGTQENFP
jgi:hypothetical protein